MTPEREAGARPQSRSGVCPKKSMSCGALSNSRGSSPGSRPGSRRTPDSDPEQDARSGSGSGRKSLAYGRRLSRSSRANSRGGSRKTTRMQRDDMEEIFCLFKQLSAEQQDTGEVPLMDMDETGSISTTELRALLGTVGMRNEKDIEELIGALDKDADGCIDYNEFCDKMKHDSREVGLPPGEVAKCFKAVPGTAPAGYVKVTDLGSFLKTYLHGEVNEGEVDRLLSQYKDFLVRIPGYEKDLFFSYQDYVDLMTPFVPRDPLASQGSDCSRRRTRFLGQRTISGSSAQLPKESNMPPKRVTIKESPWARLPRV